jgi:hypothetical protein
MLAAVVKPHPTSYRLSALTPPLFFLLILSIWGVYLSHFLVLVSARAAAHV